MIEARDVTPPQELWRFDGPYVWVGRYRILFDPVIDEPQKLILTRDQLVEAGKIIWCLGYNAKTRETQENFRKACAEVSHFKFMLPPEIWETRVPSRWRNFWRLLAVGGVIFVGAPMGLWLLSRLIDGIRAWAS